MYQVKLIFSMPIAATPAAEPMISVLPPVPAHAVLAADDAAQVLTLPVFRAVAELALVLPARG